MSLLERTILIRAERSTVFGFFTDPDRFASWWGAGSSIEGRPGGAVRIVYPGNIEATGEVLELEPEERIVFTYGYTSGQPVPAGSTRVEITLAEDPLGTRVCLRHELPDEATRDMHVPGWRHQLALFANVASAAQHESLAQHADSWFAAWSDRDAAARRRHLDACCTPAVVFRDAHGCTAGIEELDAHVAMCQAHMQATSMARKGKPRECQGTALVDWEAFGPGGGSIGGGCNVLELAPDGRISSCVGILGA
jgi:uncharacterized protein YndB with AHSA1/START domain